MTGWYLYSVKCQFFGLCLFLYGFFLINYDGGKISESISNHEFFEEPLIDTPVKKVVIMVIDGLRYDFVSEEDTQLSMPFIQDSFEARKACLFPCKVNLPTVTMPRIKAMTSGSVSSFVDIALNLGSPQMKQDNVLLRMKNHGMKVVFYGDDTWIKLFPNMFHRYEGTTSFFVRDYHEVDDNVTRNVEKELQNHDWDVMILHYLGLDHIGHVEGPKSPKIPAKLNEMDRIISLIHKFLEQIKGSGNSYLMMICSDHGMRDSGGHGGSSLPEVLVPLVTLGLNCSNITEEISQVDMAVTLTSLLNLPIPQDSIGKITHELLQDFPSDVKLKLLRANVKHLMKKYLDIIGPLKTGDPIADLLEEAELLLTKNIDVAYFAYVKLSNELSSLLLASLSKFDVVYLYIATLIFVQGSFLPLLQCSWENTVFRSFICAGIIVGILLLVPIFFHCHVSLCNLSLTGIIFTFWIAVFVSFNFFCFSSSWKFMMRSIHESVLVLKSDPFLTFIIFGSFLRIFSTISTSLIEEEHMIWYFLWTTFVFIVLSLGRSKKQLCWIAALLTFNRVLESLNQTGDKYSALPDLGDWFSKPENKWALSFFLILELVCLSYVFKYFLNFGLQFNKTARFRKLDYLYRVFTNLSLIFIYVYRSAVNEVNFFETVIFSVGGVFEFQIYLCICFIAISLKFMDVSLSAVKKNYGMLFLGIFLRMWISLIAVVSRPYNLIIIVSLVLNSHWLYEIFSRKINQILKLVILHHWLARVHYFLQGNSNSLATIDVAAGYVGQSQYNAVLVGSLILINMYGMPILSYTLMFEKVLNASLSGEKVLVNRYNLERAGKVLLTLDNFHIAFYLIIVILQRHHLFIWSVFSPKLLYDSAYSVIFYTVIVILFLIARKLEC